jgi:hypothetical protein
VLLRGLNDCVDSNEHLCELLLKFEKQNGTIESFTLAKLKCDKIFDQINAENAKIAAKDEELKKSQNKKPKQQEPPQQKKPQQQQKQPKQKEVQNKQTNNLKRKVSCLLKINFSP